MPLFTLVIPVYCHDAQGYLRFKQCLNSLQAQWFGDFSVVVVDDGSPEEYVPGTLKREAPYRTHWIRLPGNQGRAVARNVGWRAAQTPWIVFLDADMVLHPEALGAHFRFHRTRGQGWIGQGKVIGQNQRDVLPVASVWTDASQAFFATGHVSVAREALELTQGFDEAFTQYGWEDLELGLRLQQAGYRRAQVKTATAYHWEPLLTASQWPRDLAKEQQRARGALHLLAKHPQQGRFLCQATFGDAASAAVLRRLLPASRLLPGLLQLQRTQPKMALALYRGILHQYYVQALQDLLKANKEAPEV